MIFFQNFEKKSSRFWKVFKKSSKVTQGGATTPLTSYIRFRTFWWVFMAKKIFLWSMLKNKISRKSRCFLFKEKKSWNSTPRYTHDFWKMLLLKNIYTHRRMQSTYSRTTHVIRLATQMPFIKHKNSSFQLYFGHFPTCHMGAPIVLVAKKIEKTIKISQIFFLKNRV